KDISARRIDAHMPLGIECIDVEKRIAKVLPQMNGKAMRINLQVIDVDKILKAQSIQPKIEKVKPKTESKLAGKNVQEPVAKIEQPVKSFGERFTIHLKPPFDDFVKIHSDSQIMYYGLPGSGKTWDQIALAIYLATVYNLPVLYVAAEEFGRATFDEKITEQKIKIADRNRKDYWEAVNGKVVFTRSMNTLPPGKTLDSFKVFIFDSVDKMRWKLIDFENFCLKFPNKIKVITKQTTKEGDFKGGQEWAHEVDVEIEVRNKKRIFWKNRNDPKFSEKRDKLLLEDRIRVKKDRVIVNEEVKKSIQPEGLGGRALATFIPDTIV